MEGIVETLMNKTVGASRIFDLSSVKIGNPVLDINFSLESNNNSIILLRVACETMNIQDCINKWFSLSDKTITLVSGKLAQTLQAHLEI